MVIMSNMDFISDPEKVRWAHFIKDRRYLYEEIGLFEGAYLYKKRNLSSDQ